MKNFSRLSFMFIFMMLFINIQWASSQNHGVKIGLSSYESNKVQFRLDDLLLGEHTNDIYDAATDKRIRSFTYSAWFKTDETATYKRSCQIIGLGMADYYGLPGSCSVNLAYGDFQLNAQAWSGGDGWYDLPAGKPSPKVTCQTDKWYFISIVVDEASKEVRFYLDGELKATLHTGDPRNGIYLSSKKSVFFLNNGTSGGNISAIYDEVQLWNKVLTADEIKSSMKGYLAAPEGLVGYYTLDNPSSVNTYPNEGYGAKECPATIVAMHTFGYTDPYGEYAGATLLSEDCKVDGCEKVDKSPAKYMVTVEKEGQGTVVLVDKENEEHASGTEFEDGTELTVKATPAANYQVDSIKVNETKLDINIPEFTVSEETTVEVFFSLMKTRIAVDNGSSEGGKYSCFDVASNKEFASFTDHDGTYYSIPYTTNVKINTEANEGYSLSSIEVKNAENSPVTLTDNAFVVASPSYTINLSFDKLFVVDIEKKGQGTVVLSDANNVEYPSGSKMKDQTVLTVKVTPAANYQLDSVVVNEAKLDLNNLKFKVTEKTTVKVYLSLMKTRIKVDDGTNEGGKYKCINPDTNNEYGKVAEGADSFYEILYGSKVKVKTEANQGYVWSKTEVKDADNNPLTLDNENSFTVESSKYVIALSFDRVYTVSFVASEGGTVELKDAKGNVISGNEVLEGTQISITPVADENYKLESLKVNNTLVNLIDGSHQMEVNSDVAIEAKFRNISGISNVASDGVIYYNESDETIFADHHVNTMLVFDFTGKNILVSHGNEMNVSSLSPGIYVVKLVMEGRAVTMKLVKK